MRAWRALSRAVRRTGPDADGLPLRPEVPPQYWGRIGAYEGVTRYGILFLLAPEPVHPSRRVKSGA